MSRNYKIVFISLLMIGLSGCSNSGMTRVYELFSFNSNSADNDANLSTKVNDKTAKATEDSVKKVDNQPVSEKTNLVEQGSNYSTKVVEQKIKDPIQPAKENKVSNFIYMKAPVSGKIISRFGNLLDGVPNAGINISVPVGTMIRAAADGEVIYSGSGLKNFGQLILIQHPDDLVSVYAHNSKLLVKKGDIVKVGQAVALSGMSGSVVKPQLHFELRKNHSVINPESYITFK